MVSYRPASSRNDMSLTRCGHVVKCAVVTFLLVFYRPSVAAAVNYNVFSDGACERQTDGRTDRQLAALLCAGRGV